MSDEDFLRRINQEDRHTQVLNVAQQGLTRIPPEIARLTELRDLDLCGNRLPELPAEIGCLSKLERLAVTENQLESLPASIGHLSTMRVLELGRNRFTEIPEVIFSCASLEELYIWGNPIRSFPEQLYSCNRLRVLDATNCQIQTLSPKVEQLRCLERLCLNDNYLKTLPPELGHLRTIKTLELLGNQQLMEPPTAVVAQGTSAIVEYLRGILQKEKRKWVSKLLVVGEGGTGKTQLLRSLKDQSFQEASLSTRGTELGELSVRHPERPDTIMTLRTWDFGGQEIYHATHQFFLSDRSLFLLVWNARLGFEQCKLYYWLDTIKALAPESPILVVGTYLDERSPDLPFADLKKKYPSIKDFHSVSNKNRYTGDGISKLLQAITKAASQLPLMGQRWPDSWLRVQDLIAVKKEKYKPAAWLWKIMEECSVYGESQRVLARCLHELGDVVFFQDDPELADTVLLDGHWLTHSISLVLDCEGIKDGIFTRRHMEQVWSEVPKELWDRLLRLMEKFDLSYRIPEDPVNLSMVVERLLSDPPSYEPLWGLIKTSEDCRELCMRFYIGNTRPAGIPTWFIARSHRFTTNHHWRYGALLQDNSKEHLALISTPPSTSDAVVTLRVRGPEPHSFFVLLKDGLEVVLARFHGLKKEIKRTIPCPGLNCNSEFDVENLQRRLRNFPTKPGIECHNCFTETSVPKLLFGIDWPTTEQQVIDVLEERFQQLERQNAYRQREVLASQIALANSISSLKMLTQRQFLLFFNTLQRLPESHCPRVFAIRPVEGNLFTGLLHHRVQLALYCEAPGLWHPLKDRGIYEIATPARWLNSLAPYIRRLVQFLKFLAPIAGPSLAYATPQMHDLITTDVKLMTSLIEKLPCFDIKPNPGAAIPRDLVPQRANAALLRILRSLLNELDEKREWGGLQKVLTPEGDWLWLCEEHAKEYSREDTASGRLD